MGGFSVYFFRLRLKIKVQAVNEWSRAHAATVVARRLLPHKPRASEDDELEFSGLLI